MEKSKSGLFQAGSFRKYLKLAFPISEKMEKERILITGSNGILGATLIKKLKRRPDVKIYAISKGANRNPDKLGYLYEPIDITDFEALHNFFKKYKPTTVIHTAAITNVDKCELEPEVCRKVNVEGTENVAELSKLFGSYMVFISTDFVFDGEAGPYDENAEPNPISVYGKSKYDAEQKILAMHFPASILRTILVYGVVPSAARSNIVLWAKKNLEQKKPLRVVTDQFRTPTFVEDLADGCILAFRKKAQGIYHISGKDFMSIYQMVLDIADFWNLDKSLITPISSEELKQPAKRPPRTGFNLLKAQTELGYDPCSFYEGLEIIDSQLKDLN